MSVVLLDTNIVSFVLKEDSRAKSYAPHLENRRLAISLMTVAELFQWAAIRKWGARRTSQLEASLRNYIILPFDIALCRLWGEIRARCRAAGRPISHARQAKAPGIEQQRVQSADKYSSENAVCP